MKVNFKKIDHNVEAVETDEFGWTDDEFLYREGYELGLEESAASMYY